MCGIGYPVPHRKNSRRNQMFREDTTGESTQRYSLNRRSLLQSAIAGSGFIGSIGLAGAEPSRGKSNTGGNDNGGGNGGQKGFPPDGITEYGRAIELGNGEVRPFTSETPSGVPKYHGVEFDRAALEGLPSEEALADADNTGDEEKYRAGGQAATIHFKRSLQFFVPFPDAARTPFTFLGLNWNPGGHYGGQGAWLRPHFDVHFHMLDPATIDSVEGPQLPPYDTSNGEYEDGSPEPDPDGEVTSTRFDYTQLPEGYARSPEPVADQRYITDMGEHTAPLDAPELPGNPEAFTNTLIQGFVGVGENDDPRLAFVEPMVTREFLRGFSGTENYDVPQPEEYPHDQYHPTGYSIRDIPAKDAIAVVLQTFEQV